MKHRLLAAALFVAAALGFWAVLALTWGGIGETLLLGLLGVVSALCCGFVVGPRLAVDAKATSHVTRGALAGLVVTLVAYLVGVCAMGMWIVAHPERYGDIMGRGADAFGFTLAAGFAFGLVFLPVSLPFGSIAGWLFYRIAKDV